MNKILGTIEEALIACGIKDGMTLAFHHHLRDGDYVTPMVLKAAEKMGIRGLRITTSGFMDGMARYPGMMDLVENETITDMDLTGCGSIYGELLSRGKFKNVAKYRTHGGRAAVIETGKLKVDIIFVAASQSDCCGNCNGIYEKSSFGSMGYPMVDVHYADKVVIVTDCLADYPLKRAAIDERVVDYVVAVDSIGDTGGIVSGILKPAKDPVSFKLGEYAAKVIKHSGFYKEGVSMQFGGSGISISATKQIHAIMREDKIHGSFLLGGITGYSVDMLEDDLFDVILDTQSFDKKAINHLRDKPERHREISCSAYASPAAKSCAVQSNDITILGALQIDREFNVNVNLRSDGVFTGGAGGHGDTAEESKLTLILAPLFRTRIPTVVKKVLCLSTKGEYVDAFICQYGVAVNPKNIELADRLKEAKIPLVSIEELEAMALKISGEPREIHFGDKPVCEIYQRDGMLLDTIYNVL